MSKTTIYQHTYTDDEIMTLNEMIFKEEQEKAAHCSQRHHGPNMVCDSCPIMQACSSLGDQF